MDINSFNNITNTELASLLSLNDTDFSKYFDLSNEIRKKNVGDEIQIRALLEFSNYCKKQCLYCGLNCKNNSVKRFRLSPEQIIDLATNAYKVGYKTIVLQSGEDAFFTTDILSNMVKKIKKIGITVTLSCGEMSYDDYEILKKSGADRYLLKHETSNEILYKKLHPDSDFKTRKQCLINLKKLRFETGGGFMIGLPEQSLLDIANDLLLLKEIGCDMAGIGPFISHPDTMLKGCPSGDTNLTLRVVALARILLPTANLPATTSLGVLEKEQKNKVFLTGANVIMKKITPNNLKSLYEIYPAKFDDVSIAKGRKNVENQIIALSRIPV